MWVSCLGWIRLPKFDNCTHEASISTIWKLFKKVNYFFSTKKQKCSPSSDCFWQKCAYVDRAKKVIVCQNFETASFTNHQKSWKTQKKGRKRVLCEKNEDLTSSHYAYFKNKYLTNSVCSGNKVLIYFYRFAMGIKLSHFLIKLLFFVFCNFWTFF